MTGIKRTGTGIYKKRPDRDQLLDRDSGQSLLFVNKDFVEHLLIFASHQLFSLYIPEEQMNEYLKNVVFNIIMSNLKENKSIKTLVTLVETEL